jgi:hypothetical protein
MLSMHHYAPHAFPALKVWYDVHRLGRRYAIPKVDEFPKVPIPHHGWFYIGEFNADAPVDGLRDYSAEQWNRYLHPDRAGTYAHTTAGERVVWFEESNQLEVDAESSCLFVTCTYDAHWVQRSQQHAAIDSARFWLNERILRLPRGMSQRYQEMAKRGQYFARLAERHNLTPAELDAHLIKHGIGNAEHQRLLEISTQLAPSPQLDLFSLAA